MFSLSSRWYFKYVPVVIIYTIVILVFSFVMSGVSAFRFTVYENASKDLNSVYNGPLVQTAPSLQQLDSGSSFYKENKLTPYIAQLYRDNTSLVATNGEVKIYADFVKKGLAYQPTYRTEFVSVFTLKNTLDKESIVSFEFPFPVSTNSSEISNAVLLVDGVKYDDAKVLLNPTDSYLSTQGLKWEGKINAKSDVKITVSYNTVGLSQFTYTGIENSKTSQDFDFKVNIFGTRAYNVISGLSVDKREFGDGNVALTWSKKNLYSAPSVNVSVGDKINPSEQVSRVYITMAPIFLIFAVSIIFLSRRFSKGIRLIDLSFLTVLFVVFFPLFHYLSSFTIDPTTEIFANMSVAQYSMPLYLAFGISFVLIGLLAYYLMAKTISVKFATKLGIPILVLALGFFPLVATIPEYFILLTLIGVIAIIVIAMQVRLSEAKNLNV